MIAVNGVAVAETAVFAEMQHHPAATPEAAQRQAATALVVREVLRQRARELAIPGDDDATVDALIAREVTLPTPDDATCRRYFDANRGKFRSPDLLEARHILIAAAPDDPVARDAAKAKATALIAELEARPDAFAALANTHSDCPSKAMGGNLGQITRGSTVPEFETFLFSLEAGELCPVPIESRYGFHIARLERRIEGRDLPYEAIAQDVAAHLSRSAWRTAIRQYLQLLIGRARIEGLEIAGADSPLVQ